MTVARQRNDSRVDGRRTGVGGRLTGDGDDGGMATPAGGADGGSVGNIWHIFGSARPVGGVAG